MKKITSFASALVLLSFACTPTYVQPVTIPVSQVNVLNFSYMIAGYPQDTILKFPGPSASYAPFQNGTTSGNLFSFAQLSDSYIDTLFLLQWKADASFLKAPPGPDTGYVVQGRFTIVDSAQLHSSLPIGLWPDQFSGPLYPGTIQISGGGLGTLAEPLMAVRVDYHYEKGYVQTTFQGYLFNSKSDRTCYLQGKLNFFHR